MKSLHASCQGITEIAKVGLVIFLEAILLQAVT
jgi:hypothetical protein